MSCRCVPPARIGRSVDATALLGALRRAPLGAGVLDRCAAACASSSTRRTGRRRRVAPTIIEATGATVDLIHAEPDGDNINARLWGDGIPRPWRPSSPRAAPTSGFAFDGDADRCVAIDATGEVVDGDRLIGVLAVERLSRGALPGGALVVSVLSNGGLAQAVEAAGGRVVRTPVGDKYILEGMQVSGADLGRREERPCDRARALDLGRRPRDRARGAAGDDRPSSSASPISPPTSRCSRSSSGRSVSATRTSGRATSRCAGRSRTRKPASAAPGGSSSGRPARSPCCASWSRARTRVEVERWPTPSRPSRSSGYTDEPQTGGRRVEKGRATPHVRHRRLHRSAGSGPHPDRGAQATRVSGLRLGRDRARRRGRRAVRREEGGQARQPRDGAGRPHAPRRDRHRAHPLGDPRPPQRPERPSRTRTARATSRSSTTGSSRTSGSSATASWRAATRSPRRPTRRRSPTSSRRRTRATSPTPSARRCASSTARTRWW